MLLLPHYDNRREHDSTCMCLCVFVRVCWWWDAHTLLHTDMHVVGWCVLSRQCSIKQNLGLNSVNLKSVLVHLNLACVWTNCVGMMCPECFAFLCPFEIKELKKKWDHNVKNIYSCFCITGESCAQILCIYNVVHYRGTLFFGTILYIAIAVKSNRPYIILCRSCSRSVLFVLFCFF